MNVAEQPLARFLRWVRTRGPGPGRTGDQGVGGEEEEGQLQQHLAPAELFLRANYVLEPIFL